MPWRGLVLLAALLLIGTVSTSALTIKLGSLAPASSPWDNVLRRLAADFHSI